MGFTIKAFQGRFRWLSNFVRCPVLLYGVAYPSVENAYQAAKATDAFQRTPFVNLTAGQAKKAGRKLVLRGDWEAVKLEVMESLIRQKYSQEPFKTWLRDTGTSNLEEGNTWGDTFWGVCNGEGENHLGRLIMKIRAELFEH